MTRFAYICGFEVRGRFSLCQLAIMASEARLIGLRVIKSRYRHPSRRNMAPCANIRGLQMRRALAGGEQIIVARRARHCGGAVVHHRANVKTLRHVTNIALFNCWNVIYVFPARSFSIMASRA